MVSESYGRAYRLSGSPMDVAALCDLVEADRRLRDAVMMRIIDPALTYEEFDAIARSGRADADSCRSVRLIERIIVGGPRNPSPDDGRRVMTFAEGIACEAWERDSADLHAVAGYLMWVCGDRGTCGLEARAALMIDRDTALAKLILQLLRGEPEQDAQSDGR